jgi:hypothetical protein
MSLGELRGRLDQADRQSIAGWAQDEADPERRVGLVLMLNGEIIGRFLANQHRQDLEDQGLGSGRHAFWIRIPATLSATKSYLIAILREVDGAPLPGSPILLDPLGDIDPNLERGLTKAVGNVIDECSENRLLNLLARQTDALLQRRANRETLGIATTALTQFRQRWGERLSTIDGPDPVPPTPAKRALMIDDRVADPARDAGSVAALSHMQALAALGYEVSLAPAAEMEGNTEGYARMETLGFQVWRAPFYSSIEELLRRQHAGFEIVYLHRFANAAKYLTLVRHYMPKARVIYSVADLHHLRLQRQADIESRPELATYSRQVKLNEMVLAWSADAVITHSTEEAAILKTEVPAAKIHVVPWALTPKPVARRFARQHGVVFIGHYAHVPNTDAAHWLAQVIMPLVWRTNPDIVCTLVGSAMPHSVRQLEAPGVQIAGQVENLDTVLAQARLTVAPLRYGAGVKGKVLESFARGVPCAMTPIAAEGLALPAPLQDLVGASAADVARVILRLHDDEAAHRHARDDALAFIHQRHSADSVITALRAATGD